MKQRIYEIDIFRTFACFCVIVIHTTATPISSYKVGTLQFLAAAILNRALLYAVPAFIFLSGLTLFYTYQDKAPQKRSFFNSKALDAVLSYGLFYVDFFKKRLLGVLLPYFVWVILYAVLRVKLYHEHMTLKYFMWALSMGKMSYHLYFVVIITQFYLLFFLFRFLYKRINTHVLTILFLALNLFFTYKVKVQYKERWFLSYIIFFALGCYFAANYQTIKEKLLKYKLVVIGVYLPTVAFFVYQYYQYFGLKKPVKSYQVSFMWIFMSLVSIGTCYLISLLILHHREKWLKYFKQVSASSYYIYLGHPFLLMLLNDRWKKIGYKSITGKFVINTSLVFLIVIPLSIAYVAGKGMLKTRIHQKKEKSLGA